MDEKKIKEKNIFDKLVSEIPETHCPFSTKFNDSDFLRSMSIKKPFEIIGIFMEIFCGCFEKMRESKGESNWEVSCKQFLVKCKFSKRKLSLEKLYKFLLVFLSLDLIDYVKDIEGEILIKFNACTLFSEV